MRVAYLCLSLPLLMLAGTACAGEEDLGCTADTQCREGRVCIDNACAPDTSRRDHDFFGQFVYEVSERPVEGVEAWPDEVPRSRGFRLNAFLMENGDAIIFYEEGTFGHGFSPHNRRDGSDPRRRIPTSWSIVNDEVIVGDVLICTGAPPEGRRTFDALLCEVQRPIMDRSTEGVSMYMHSQYVRPTAPDDEKFSEFADE